MADVKKGVVSSVKDEKATVVLGEARNAVTCELIIPWDLYEFVNVGDSVAFVQFDDGTGLILARMDGKRSTKIKGDLILVDGKISADGINSDPSTNIETYTGEYEITPSCSGKTLPTANKFMTEDIKVLEIPRREVENEAGGTTIYIANEV